MKRHLIKLIAALSACGAAISFILAIIFSFEEPLLVFLAIMNAFAFIVLTDCYKATVKQLEELSEIL